MLYLVRPSGGRGASAGPGLSWAPLFAAQVFEYLDTDLKKFMDATGRGPTNPLPHATVQNFMYQLCIGIAHMHRHGVMHRCGAAAPGSDRAAHALAQGPEAAESAGGQGAQHPEDC